ncbi:hypothetical protein ACFVH6_35610 [Spirillospora sp. NPDC127200]
MNDNKLLTPREAIIVLAAFAAALLTAPGAEALAVAAGVPGGPAGHAGAAAVALWVADKLDRLIG